MTQVRMFGSREKSLISVISNVRMPVLIILDARMLVRRTKHELIIKLIVQMETNLRDESIKTN
jgi:hypothetical protein